MGLDEVGVGLRVRVRVRAVTGLRLGFKYDLE